MGRSSLSEPPVVIGVTTAQVSAGERSPMPPTSPDRRKPRRSKRTRGDAESHTAGSARPNSETTSSGRGKRSKPNSRDTRSSPTSDLVSTSEGGDSSPWWTPSAMEMSKRLWLPTGIGSVASDSTSSSTSVTETLPVSWSSITRTQVPSPSSSTTYSPLSMSSAVAFTASDPMSGPLRRCRKVMLRPTMEQIQILRRWFGAARDVYNVSVDRLRSDMCLKEKDLREGLTTDRRGLVPGKEYLKETPNHIRQLAITDLVSARRSAWANKGAGNIRHFAFKYRTRKDRTETIRIDNVALKRDVSGKAVTPFVGSGIGPVACAEWVPPTKAEYKIFRDRCGDFYLIVPFEIPAVVRGDTQALRVAALDPGVRTFQSYYSVDGEVGEIAPFAGKRIWGLHRRARHLLKEANSSCHQRSRNLRKASARYFSRVDDLLSDLHFKASRFLCNRFNVIYLPSFRVSGMVKRQLRKIRSITVNHLLALCHYKFGQRLRYQAQKLGCCVRETSEWYTSKTCGCCGHLHRSLGSNKVFSCPSCGIRLDRDLNGARNNLLRGLLFH